MKKFMFKFGITWATLVCVLLLFEMTSAQAGDIDLSVVDCSVEKIPGTDSVLIKTSLQYWVGGTGADSIHFRLSVEFDGTPVGSGDVRFSVVDHPQCTDFPPPCYGNCPDIWAVSPPGCYPTGPWLFVGTCGEKYPLSECFCFYEEYVWFKVTPGPPDGAMVSIAVDDTYIVQELDEDNNVCSFTYTPADAIPTLTEWGMIIMFVIMAAGIVWFVVRNRRRMATAA